MGHWALVLSISTSLPDATRSLLPRRGTLDGAVTVGAAYRRELLGIGHE
ncbi:hypothetical protein [Nostoc sp.]